MIIKKVKNAHILLDFVRGQKDCKDGRPCAKGQSQYYEQGYRCQYEHEQVRSALYG